MRTCLTCEHWQSDKPSKDRQSLTPHGFGHCAHEKAGQFRPHRYQCEKWAQVDAETCAKRIEYFKKRKQI